MKSISRTFCNIGTKAKWVLLIGLPVIILELIWTLGTLVFANVRQTVSLIHTFPIIMENILLSLVLLVGGAILFDLCEKEAEEKI